MYFLSFSWWKILTFFQLFSHCLEYVFWKAFSQSSLQTFCSWKNSRFFYQKKSFGCKYIFTPFCGGKYSRFFKHFASCVFMNRSWLKKLTFSWLFFSVSLFLGRKNSRFFKHNFCPVMCCGNKNSRFFDHFFHLQVGLNLLSPKTHGFLTVFVHAHQNIPSNLHIWHYREKLTVCQQNVWIISRFWQNGHSKLWTSLGVTDTVFTQR